jgi:hypothetical protein
MRGLLTSMVLAAGAACLAGPPERKDNALKVGDAAPTFELKKLGTDTTLKLADLLDKPVVLVFGSCS